MAAGSSFSMPNNGGVPPANCSNGAILPIESRTLSFSSFSSSSIASGSSSIPNSGTIPRINAGKVSTSIAMAVDGKDCRQKETEESNQQLPIISKLLPSECPPELRRQRALLLSSTDSKFKAEMGEEATREVNYPLLLSLEGYSLSGVKEGGGLEDDSDFEEDLWTDDEDDEEEEEKVDHETRKRSRWYRRFFEILGGLTNEELKEHDRQWHCPACKGGPGAIDWFRGLLPLLTHAKTIRSKRVKLHVAFADILEDELRRRCCAVSASATATIHGRWKGLREDDETSLNPLIIWPPMVVIQNTKLELDEADKWIGMGNKELLDIFKDYNVLRAKHAYGPQGHLGMSLAFFVVSPAGYMDAERLHNHFEGSRRGRSNWENAGKFLFYPGGDRVLYGYMPTSEDMEIFNQNSGKSKIKYTMQRLFETVVEPMRKMDGENVQINLLRRKAQKHKEESKTLEKTMCFVMRKLRLKERELEVIRDRALEQLKDNKKEMDYLEKTYKERLHQLRSYSSIKEEVLRKKVECFNDNRNSLKFLDKNNDEDIKRREEQQEKQFAGFEEQANKNIDIIESDLKNLEGYEMQNMDLLANHHVRRLEFWRRQYEENLQFEGRLESDKLRLFEKYLECMQERFSQIKNVEDKEEGETS